ncbi:unnamed protein product [Protopolystoma xenopodis]|uniref:dihydropyrimidinase n=1 Tax=Protopolystoma xenopodis TaxID=117903 RepID=A0A448WGY8_9PLAT|nr:unnamed protein product [Protopolystoma xenopodis]
MLTHNVVGGVDIDCSLMKPSNAFPVADNNFTGSLFALRGGTTTILSTIHTEPNTSLVAAFNSWMIEAGNPDTGLRCDYAVCPTLPGFSLDVVDEMRSLVSDHGVACFSLDHLGPSVDYSSQCQFSSTAFLGGLSACRDLGALACITASVSKIISDRISTRLINCYPKIGPEGHMLSRPERGECDCVSRAALLACHASDKICPLLIRRICSAPALSTFSQLRCNGNLSSGLIFGMTTAPALGSKLKCQGDRVLSFSSDWSSAAGCVSNPPIRIDPEVSQYLAAHLAAGDLSAVGSSHLAFSTIVKASLGRDDFRRLPEGIAAIGARLPVVWQTCVRSSGLLDPCSFVSVVSTNPARLANLYPRKGLISPGSDADLLVWNPEHTLDHGN